MGYTYIQILMQEMIYCKYVTVPDNLKMHGKEKNYHTIILAKVYIISLRLF